MSSSIAQPIRIGVIGLGWAGETHIKAYQQLPNVELIGLADVAVERVAQVAASYGIPHHYSDYRELLARDDIDAVSICTPNQFHAPAAIAALSGGKHVLCEKPLARTGQEGESIVQAARAAGRVLQIAFNHRQRGDVQALKAYIETGALGRIYYAKAYWMRRANIPSRGGWFMNRDLAGGGPLIDLGVHALDMALYLMDEPAVASVSANTYNELGTRGRGGDGAFPLDGSKYQVEDLATAFLRLRNGATLLLEASWATYSSAQDDYGVSLYGSDAGAELAVKNYTWDDTLRVFNDIGGVPAVAQLKPRRRDFTFHQGVIEGFIATIRSGEWQGHDGADGLLRARVIDACYESARLGHEVTLDANE